MIRQIMLNLFLALVWVLLQNSFTAGNFLGGFVIGAIILWVFRRGFDGDVYLGRVAAVFELTLVFLWEMLKANITVATLVLSRNVRLNPGIVAVPVELKSDVGTVLLANLITLTPGTLTVDASPDHTQLYVHVLNITDENQVRQEIKEKFEKRILRILGRRS